MTEQIFHGERRIVFKKNTDVPNEVLDTTVYAFGAAEISGLSRTTEKGWNTLRRELGLLPPEADQKPKGRGKKNLLDES